MSQGHSGVTGPTRRGALAMGVGLAAGIGLPSSLRAAQPPSEPKGQVVAGLSQEPTVFHPLMPCIEVDHLPPELRVDPPHDPRGPVDADMTWQAAIDHARDRMAPGYLRTLLAAAQGNVVAAANRAGIERESFYRLLRKYGVRADEFRGRGHA